MEITLFFLVNAFVNEDFLFIEYEVTNKTTDLCYLINVLTNCDMSKGIEFIDTNKVFFDINNGKLVISKKRPIDDTLELKMPEPYFVTPIEPGGQFSEMIKIKLPVTISQKNGNNNLILNSNTLDHFIFNIGFIIDNELLKIKTINFNGTNATMLITSGKKVAPEDFKPVEEFFLTSEVKNVRIPIKTTLKL